MPTPPSGLLPSQRHCFDLPRDIAYFNCGYMGPLARETVTAGQAAMARKARPWTIRPADFFEVTEAARSTFGTLLGVEAGTVALVPSVSFGMATAAAILPLSRGQRVLMLDEEFPSVIYAWQARARAVGAEAVLLPRPADGDWTRSVLEAIDRRTAVAALPALHWTDGSLVDLEAIGARLREVGAALAVDATQSLGAMPLDLAAIRPDLLVAAGYKWLLGPYSIGYLYVEPRWHQGPPLEHNWFAREGSEDFAGLVRYRDGFQAGARRFDVGESANFALLPAAQVALGQILDWHVPRIAATLAATTLGLEAAARPYGLTGVDSSRRAPHYLGLRRPGGLPAGLGDRLAAQGVYVSTRGDALRITPHLYNDADDLARFEAALAAALA